MTDSFEAIPTISPEELHGLLISDGEHALIDVREVDPFSNNHLLFAVPVPLGRLEILVPKLLPRLSIPIIVCDDNEGLAYSAVVRLYALGYTSVSVLEGGIKGWEAAGYEVYSGVNVPSKAFGEFIEHEEGTPSLSADEVHQMMQDGEDMIILDSRPFTEFNWASIPSGLCCSGAELVYRAFSTIPSPDTKVIVNCAGRTRSIIGAQSLINAGLPNNVYALRNGIMGWRLSGLKPAAGESNWAPMPNAAGLSKSMDAAEGVASRFDVTQIEAAELVLWRAERTSRSLFLLDVRTIEEYEAGHLTDALHAPGGQVVQATDEYIGARNARIVLVDNDGVRASMTASWLIQMGQKDVRILKMDSSKESVIQGAASTPVIGLEDQTLHEISAQTLIEKQLEGAVVLDLSLSPAYRAGHISGAWFALRSQLQESLAAIPDAKAYILTSEDGTLAKLCIAELQALVDESVYLLAGGNVGWSHAGYELTKAEAKYAVDPIDVWRIPFIANEAKGETVEDAMRAYLSWEVDLMTQLGRDGSTRFVKFSADKSS
jgi:rhodanese-related sulfurtransferase